MTIAAAALHEKICQYLYFGYAIDKDGSAFIEDCLSHRPRDLANTPEDAARLLDMVIDELVEQVGSSGSYIVPISAGLDSRLILGALRQRLDARQITTVTFGTPGQIDYDIGALIARRLGLAHYLLDLRSVELTWEGLLASVREAPWTNVPDAYYNRQCIVKTGITGAAVVRGFPGDALTGRQLLMCSTPEETVQRFVARQKRSSSVELAPPQYDPAGSLPPLSTDSPVLLSDLLDMMVWQVNCVAPIIASTKKWRAWGMAVGTVTECDARVFAPYIHPAWAGYWLSVPQQLKVRQVLYKQLLAHAFPDLAGLPFKYSYGVPPSSLWRLRLAIYRHRFREALNVRFPLVFPRPRAFINYLDYASAFRTRRDYRMLMDTAFAYLKDNRTVPWLKLDAIRSEHMSGARNHEDALLVLIGLALNLTAEEV
jgi:hypothetical protein